jgi:arylsulfatase A-like enzyme/Tfp pilus assembly protein PilF
VLIAALGALAWSVYRGRTSRVGFREFGANILLITVDTLRADAMGAYGNAQANTPWMDRLAASGVRFDPARAHNVVTLPSHANILSGTYPLHHGVRDNSGFRFPADRPTLATILKQHGYATAAFISAFPLASQFGLQRGFDVYDDDFVGTLRGQAFLVQERAGVETVARAKRWIEQAPAPWFAWIHLYEPHYPYAPPEPFTARFRGHEYAGEVAAADAALGPVLEPILAGRDARGTLVVLTADHGESLGEHGEATHGILAYESTLRVPLVLYLRGLAAGRTITEPARHVDVLPTVLDALALDAAPDLDGESLVSRIDGRGRPDVTTYFEALSGMLNRGWAPLHGMLRGNLKYVDLPMPELYDVAADPGETQNIAQAQPGLVREMRELLSAARTREHSAARQTESAEARQRLASLGYLAGGGGAARQYSEADDPKRLITLDARLQEVVFLYERRDLDAAIEKCRDLIRERPGMAVSLLYLAQLERDRGDFPAAIDTLRKALALNPVDVATTAMLAASLTQAGRAQEALRVLDGHAPDDETADELIAARALTLAQLHRFDEAIEVLERAARSDPANPALMIETGTVHLMAGHEAIARRAFERALELDPRAAEAHSALGAIAAESGRADDARRHWKRAVEVDPREYAKLFALGVGHARAGRSAVARTFFEFFVGSAPTVHYVAEIKRAQRWLDQQRQLPSRPHGRPMR